MLTLALWHKLQFFQVVGEKIGLPDPRVEMLVRLPSEALSCEDSQ